MQDEYVRDQLRVALCDLPLMQKGQIAIMSDMAGGDSFTDKPSRMVESGSGAVTIEAEPVRYRQGKKYKQNTPLIMEADFKTGIWRAVVNRLPDTQMAWANYCYGERLKFDHQVTISAEIWYRFLKAEEATGQRKMAKKTTEKVRSLVWLAVQVIARDIRGPKLEYSGAELGRLLGVELVNWQNNYLPRWSQLLKVCQDLDSEVIAHVEREHKAERDRRRRARVPVQKSDAA